MYQEKNSKGLALAFLILIISAFGVIGTAAYFMSVKSRTNNAYNSNLLLEQRTTPDDAVESVSDETLPSEVQSKTLIELETILNEIDADSSVEDISDLEQL